MIDEAIHKRLDAQDAKLDAIHNALVGNPQLGHKGLVPRVDTLEQGYRDHDNKLLRWGGIVTGVSLTASLLKDKFLGGGG